MHNIGTVPLETRSLRHDRAAARLCMAFATASATLNCLKGQLSGLSSSATAFRVTNAPASMSRARIVKNTEALQQQAAATRRAFSLESEAGGGGTPGPVLVCRPSAEDDGEARRFYVGPFSTPSVAELRARLELEQRRAGVTTREPCRVTDVGIIHRKVPG